MTPDEFPTAEYKGRKYLMVPELGDPKHFEGPEVNCHMCAFYERKRDGEDTFQCDDNDHPANTTGSTNCAEGRHIFINPNRFEEYVVIRVTTALLGEPMP